MAMVKRVSSDGKANDKMLVIETGKTKEKESKQTDFQQVMNTYSFLSH